MLKMKKWIFLPAFLYVLHVSAQPMLDIGIFNNPLNSNKLEVRIRPSENIVDGVYSAGVFTIRHPVSYGVTLVAPSALNAPLFNYNLANQGTDGIYQYYSFSFTSPNLVNWTAGVSYPIAIIQISSGASAGTGTFEIVNNAWTAANNGNVYQELNGGLAAGFIFQATAMAPLIPGPPDTIPPSVSCTSEKTVGANPNVCSYTHAGNDWNAVGNDNYPGFLITYFLSGATSDTAFSLSGILFNKGLTNIQVIIRDGAGLADTCTFTVTVNDTQAPVITAPPAVTVSANAAACTAANVALGVPAVSDNCGTPQVTSNAPTHFPKGNTTVVWTVTDAAGLTATAVQTVTVQSGLAVSAMNVSSTSICQGSAATLTFSITGGVGPYTVMYNVNGNNITLNGYASGQPVSVSPAFTSAYALVSVTDAIGCSITPAGFTRTIVVKSAPTLFALTPSAAVACAGTPVSVTAGGLLTNAASVFQYTLNGTAGSQTVISNNVGAGILLNDIYPPGNYTLSVTSLSVAGCTATSTATATFTVDTLSAGCQFLAAGNIRTEAGAGVKNVAVSLTGSVVNLPGFSFTNITDSSGAYQFLSAIPPAANCLVAPYKNDNHLNGVTTFDLVLITKHLLGLQVLNSPYKIIAADANHSKVVTTADIVELRKMILGIYDVLPSNTSWRFVAEAYVFPDPADPFLEIFPENIAWNNVQADQQEAGFIAVKTGDVNGSVITGFALPAEDRASETLFLEARSRESDIQKSLVAGQEIIVDFKAAVHTDGFQFTLDLDGLEILEILLGAELGSDCFGVFDDAITVSYVGQEPRQEFPGFSIRFRVKSPGMLRDKLHLSSRITAAEAYRQTAGDVAEKMEVELRFGDAASEMHSFEVFQNRPNPFFTTTSIPFYLPDPEEVTLSISDEMGRAVYLQKQAFTAGRHQFDLKGDLLPAGVLSYQIRTSRNVAVKKMIKQ